MRSAGMACSSTRTEDALTTRSTRIPHNRVDVLSSPDVDLDPGPRIEGDGRRHPRGRSSARRGAALPAAPVEAEGAVGCIPASAAPLD